MANSFELITKYLPQALDKYFYEDSKTVLLENGNKYIDVNFNETGYVKIASLLLDGLSDYYRTQNLPGPSNDAQYAAYAGNLGSGMRDGFAIGNGAVTWEIFKLQYCRGKQFRFDYLDDEETAGIIIGNAVEEFNRTKVIPEVDATRFSLIADAASASLGNLLSAQTISANTIISNFNTAFEWLAEHEVPEEEQIIFVNPAVMTQIRNTIELNKFITQENYKSQAGLDFTVEKYAGRPIVVVPSNRFFTKVQTGANGYYPGASSYVINYMVVSAKAVVPIRKLEWSKIYGPELSGLAGFHGYLMDYLIYHGVVIPKNKIPGVYVNVSSTAATGKASTLAVDTEAGSAQYYWKLRRYFSNPAGLLGTVVINTSAFTLGSSAGTAVDATSSLGSGKYMVVKEGVDVVEAAGSKTYYFGLMDAAGNIIAATGSTAVTQHA